MSTDIICVLFTYNVIFILIMDYLSVIIIGNSNKNLLLTQ